MIDRSLKKNKVVLTNENHIAFSLEYIKTGDPTRSYMEVYPAASFESAKTLGYRLLRRDDIKAFIEQAIIEEGLYHRKFNSDKAKLVADDPWRAFSELAELAFGDPHVVTPDVKYKSLRDLGRLFGFIDSNLTLEEVVELYEEKRLESAMRSMDIVREREQKVIENVELQLQIDNIKKEAKLNEENKRLKEELAILKKELRDKEVEKHLD